MKDDIGKLSKLSDKEIQQLIRDNRRIKNMQLEEYKEEKGLNMQKQLVGNTHFIEDKKKVKRSTTFYECGCEFYMSSSRAFWVEICCVHRGECVTRFIEENKIYRLGER